MCYAGSTENDKEIYNGVSDYILQKYVAFCLRTRRALPFIRDHPIILVQSNYSHLAWYAPFTSQSTPALDEARERTLMLTK